METNTSVLGNSMNVLKPLKMLGEMLTVQMIVFMSIVKILTVKKLVIVKDLGLVLKLVMLLIKPSLI